jgi:hypothetical protein
MESTCFCGFRGLLTHQFVHTAYTRVHDDMSPLLAIRQDDACGKRPVCFWATGPGKRTFVQVTGYGT